MVELAVEYSKTTHTIVNYINDITIFKQINPYLEQIGLDIGRVALFFAILFLTFSLLLIIKNRLVPLVDKLFNRISSSTEALNIDDIEPIKSPILNILKIFGFEMALNVLLYKAPKIEFLDTLFYILYLINIILILFIIIDIVVNLYFTALNKKKNTLKKELLNLVINIVKIVVITAGILLVLKKLGVDITAFVASLGIGGLAIAMASKDTIANFFGSLKIIFDGSFSQGDWIEVGSVSGTVVELGFVSTKIRTFDNAMISLPNANLANESVKNYNKRTVGRRIKLKVGITYGSKQSDIQNAILDIRKMLQKHPGIATKDSIKQNKKSALVEINDKVGVKTTLLVYLDELADSSINILIYAFTKTVNWQEWLETKEDVLFKIMTIVEENNLEFAFPSQSLYIEKLNKE